MTYKVKGQFEISNGVCNYYDFIRREGLSLAILQYIVRYRSVRVRRKYKHDNLDRKYKHDRHGNRLVWIHIEYSLVDRVDVSKSATAC